MIRLVSRRTGVALAVLMVAGAVSVRSQDKAVARYGDVPAGAYAVVAEVRAKPGKENELRQATLPLVAAVRREPNNLLYFLHEDRESPGHFVFYEIFASRAVTAECCVAMPAARTTGACRVARRVSPSQTSAK